MRKKVLKILLIVLVILTMLTVASCDNNEQVTITISGLNTNFSKVYLIDSKYLKGNLHKVSNDEMFDLSRISSISSELYKDLKDIVDSEYVAPIDSTLTFDKTKENPFVISEEISGKKVNEIALYNDIIDGLSNKFVSLTLSYEDVEANIKVKDNEDITSLRGSFSTNYGSSSSGRKSNIELAISRINNYVIMPNGEFSFNEVVGKRSISNGFSEAVIIADGKFTKGVGGGICQVSTTLYNSAILSDLVISEARQHSLPVGYVEPSFDAMVSSWSDLKIKNQTTYPIYILCKANGKSIVFDIYGQKLDYEVKRVSKVDKVIAYQTKYVEEGEYHKGKNGIVSSGKVEYYKDGKKFFEKDIRKDYYKPQDEIIVND